MTAHIDWLRSVLTPADLIEIRATAPPPPIVTPTSIRIPGVTHEYSTMYLGNIDHRAYLLHHGTDGTVGLHKTDGGLHQLMPPQVNTGSQPRWSRHLLTPTYFYFLFLNQLRLFDVATNQVTVIRKFDEYPSINGMGESDLSADGNHMVLCSGSDIFVYDIARDLKTAQFRAPWAFDNLYITPDNDVIIGFYDHGMMVWDNRLGILRRLTAALGHQAVGRDTNGDSIMVWCNSDDSSGIDKNAAVPNCRNAVVKVRVSDGYQTCLQEFNTPGWPIAMHLSMPQAHPWCCVSTFTPSRPHNINDYGNHLLLVALDGTGIMRNLGLHGSVNSTNYLGQPRATVSPDGSRIAYDSNGDTIILKIG